MNLSGEAARLRAAAAARPLRLPVNRRVDERHRALTEDGLSVWYTIQVSAHSRIHDVLFEHPDRRPEDAEIQSWLAELLPGQQAVESPAVPGSRARRFDLFETDPAHPAPMA